jgi:hypothetical protein
MVPYMHFQGAHAIQVTSNVHFYTLGWLKNEVMEHNHKEMKNLNNNQGGGRGVAKEDRNTFEHDKMCVVNEMRAHFFKLAMRLEGTFQNFKQRRFLPSNIRNQLCVEYEKLRSPLNDKTVAQWASCFPNITSEHVKQLFHSWIKQYKKSLIAPGPTIHMD